MVTVPENPIDGTLDLRELERLLLLEKYSSESGRLRVGAFSAATNVTGVIADVDRIEVLLHRHGALASVFGIQSRGGCQCAGPYSQRLLGLTTTDSDASADGGEREGPNEANRRIERALLRSDRPCELLRPGYTRLSLPFKGLREEEAEYTVRAMAWVARNGWALLPQYRCDHRTGEWRHWSRRGEPLGKKERRWLSRFDILALSAATDADGSSAGAAALGSTDSFVDTVQASCARLDEAMKNADAILERARHDPRFLSEVEKMNSADGMLGGEGGVDDTLEALRWYVYPQELAGCLREGLQQVPDTLADDALLGGIDVRMDGARRGDRGGVHGGERVVESSRWIRRRAFRASVVAGAGCGWRRRVEGKRLGTHSVSRGRSHRRSAARRDPSE